MTIHKLAFLALMAICVLSVQGQNSAFSCTESVADAPILRAGGRSELLGEIRLECTGGISGSSYTSEFNVFLTSNYTGRLTNAATNTTESLLIVGDPASPVLGTNVFQATLRAPNAIRFSNVQIPLPGSAKLIIRIVNMRADTGGTFSANLPVPSQVLAFVTASGIPLNNPQQTVGYIGLGQRFQMTSAVGTPVTSLDFSGPGATTFKIRFDEGFQNAFRKRNTATLQPIPAPWPPKPSMAATTIPNPVFIYRR